MPIGGGCWADATTAISAAVQSESRIRTRAMSAPCARFYPTAGVICGPAAPKRRARRRAGGCVDNEDVLRKTVEKLSVRIERLAAATARREWRELLGAISEPQRLEHWGRKVYSQND